MDALKIYVDRLKDGRREALHATVSPLQLSMPDEIELQFAAPITVGGEAYLTDDHLIARLDIRTEALMPCSICNQKAPFALSIDHHYVTIPLEEIHNALYDLSDEIRETLLLHVPPFIECQEGTCPDRSTINTFLKTPSTTGASPHHFPFADLF